MCPCKRTVSLQFLQLPSVCENTRLPWCNLNTGCYFVASLFQTLSAYNLKRVSVNCRSNKRGIILRLRDLVALYLKSKSRFIALTLMPNTLYEIVSFQTTL